MLASLAGQSVLPGQVVIVDASAEPVDSVVREFPSLRIDYLRHLPPSASAQRNVGIRAVDPAMDLVAFFDDDAVLDAGAMGAMLDFWSKAPADVGGAGFNHLNAEPLRGQLKRSRLASWLGLYAATPGRVAPSGWQSLTGCVEQTLWVQWLGSGASVWRREVLETEGFDEFFDGYSYLEDLDFSYTVARKYRLAIVAEAGYRHYPSSSGRVNAFRFGKVEVRNRLYFVRKHGLSVWRCRLGLLVRLGITVRLALAGHPLANLARAVGNVSSIARDLLPLGESRRSHVSRGA
jgi:hypothetical protein